MKSCTRCGKENPDDNWVCTECGEPLGKAVSQPTEPPEGPLTPQTPFQASQPSGGRKAGGGIRLTTWLLIFAIVAIAAFVAWYFFLRKPDTSTPHGTVEAYVSAVSNKDCEAAFDLSASTDMPRDQAIQACSQVINIINFSLSDYRLIDEKITGDTATVTYEFKVTVGGQSVTTQSTADLVKQDGKWRLNSSQMLEPGSLPSGLPST